MCGYRVSIEIGGAFTDLVALERKGDRLTVRTPGGGGYGSPLEREPRMVLNDVPNELVSIKFAKSDCGVVIRSTLVIDEEETKRLRKKVCHEHASRQ